MLGHRGVRLGITYPEITEMQTRAIIEAAVEVKKQGKSVLPEIMIPLVGTVEELIILKKRTIAVAEEVMKAAGTKDSEAVVKKLKELPVDDAFAQGKVLANGRMVHDMYLFEVKKPDESKGEWDLYKQISTIPGAQAFKRPKGNECPLVKG